MLASFLTTLREGFEATLLVAIVLAYLAKVGHRSDSKYVWVGVGAAVLVSAVVSGLLFAVASELDGVAEAIFKGGTMWLAVVFLTYMIIWMSRQSRTVARDIRQSVDGAIKSGGALALALLAFVMVLREGLETALFMFGITQTSSPWQVTLGAFAGLAGASGLGYAVYAGGKRINLGAFFKITGILLLIVTAGLLARGVAIFEGAKLLSPVSGPLWDFSDVALLTHKTLLGKILISFLGWDPSPDLLVFGTWLIYLLVFGYTLLSPQFPGVLGRRESA